MRGAVLSLLLGVSLVGSIHAAVDEPPLVGRPADLPFSGASAGFVAVSGEWRVPFSLAVSAVPTRLEAGTPLTFTLRIQAATRVLHPPVRIDLRQIPAFARAFHIEALTDGQSEREGETTWRWSWRLQPRRAGLTEIPGVPFVFHNPDLRPAEKGFQVVYSEPIAIRVEAAERVGTVVEWPATVTTLASGPELLARQTPWQLPGPATLAFLVVMPPAACGLWYLLWRRLYPDGAHQQQQRRSRAARRALRALAHSGQPGRDQAEQVAAIVATYLRERIDLTAAEPTPGETAVALSQQGFSETLAQQGADLLRACAAGRFRPDEPPRQDLPERARRFIEDLEEGSCPP